VCLGSAIPLVVTSQPLLHLIEEFPRDDGGHLDRDPLGAIPVDPAADQLLTFTHRVLAAPQQPGFSVTAIDYYASVKAGGDVSLAREFEIGRFNTNFKVKLNANINANLDAHADLGILIPSYTFEQRFLGGQASVFMLTAVGRVDTTLQGQIAGTLGPFGFSKSGSITTSFAGSGWRVGSTPLRWRAATLRRRPVVPRKPLCSLPHKTEV
jgi:hypothetical protein